MRLKRLDNIDVLCTDLEAMVAFYRDVLGLPYRLPYARDEGWAGFKAGDIVIYLIEEGVGPHPPPRRSGGENPPGFDSFAFEVDDLDAAIAELDARGVSWASEVVESEWYRYRGFHDPEGNLLYLTIPKLDRSEPRVPMPDPDDL